MISAALEAKKSLQSRHCKARDAYVQDIKTFKCASMMPAASQKLDAEVKRMKPCRRPLIPEPKAAE